MWSVVFETNKAALEAQNMLVLKELTENDNRIITTWVRQVTFYGPESIRNDGKWADHELTGKWVGYRSSSFSNKGRIIYRIEENIVRVLIARITTKHDYRK